MTDPRETLARIRKQADAATDGPWDYQRGYDTPSEWQDAHVLGADGESVVSEASDENAEFIAAARTNVPRLVVALQAVLNLHFRPQPIPAAYGTQTGLDYCRTCAEDYPCPTVAAITQALEGDTNAHP